MYLKCLSSATLCVRATWPWKWRKNGRTPKSAIFSHRYLGGETCYNFSDCRIRNFGQKQKSPRIPILYSFMWGWMMKIWGIKHVKNTDMTHKTEIGPISANLWQAISKKRHGIGILYYLYVHFTPKWTFYVSFIKIWRGHRTIFKNLGPLDMEWPVDLI